MHVGVVKAGVAVEALHHLGEKWISETWFILFNDSSMIHVSAKACDHQRFCLIKQNFDFKLSLGLNCLFKGSHNPGS